MPSSCNVTSTSEITFQDARIRVRARETKGFSLTLSSSSLLRKRADALMAVESMLRDVQHELRCSKRTSDARHLIPQKPSVQDGTRNAIPNFNVMPKLTEGVSDGLDCLRHLLHFSPQGLP